MGEVGKVLGEELFEEPGALVVIRHIPEGFAVVVGAIAHGAEQVIAAGVLLDGDGIEIDNAVVVFIAVEMIDGLTGFDRSFPALVDKTVGGDGGIIKKRKSGNLEVDISPSFPVFADIRPAFRYFRCVFTKCLFIQSAALGEMQDASVGCGEPVLVTVVLTGV